jgi:hypothetical protein
MCLDELKDIKAVSRVKTGYKWFVKYRGKNRMWNLHIKRQIAEKIKTFPVGKWLDEKDYRYEKDEYLISGSDGNGNCFTYPLGFHSFINLKEAKNFLNHYVGYEKTQNWVLYKVQIHEIVAYGIQEKDRVVVSKEIRIVDGVNLIEGKKNGN